MNFRLALSFILLVSEVLASDIFYALDPLGPVCSRFATKWSYIDEHFVVVAAIWVLIAIGISFFVQPAYWNFISRPSVMRTPFMIAGGIGLLIDIGASAYQRWVATIDMSVHTWTRFGLILNAGLRSLIWLIAYSALSVAFLVWASRREANTIEN